MITKLIVASGKSAGRSITVKRDRLLIGRAEDCDVRPLSEDVSRRHAAVTVAADEVWVEDLGSRNGTFVNGARITGRTKLVSGDIVRVGGLELKLHRESPATTAGDNDVSRLQMADERPAGMSDTTRTVPPSADRPRSDASREVAHPAPLPDTPANADESYVSGMQAVAGSDSPSGSGTSGRAMAIEALKAARGNVAAPAPQPKKAAADSSRDAAAEALRKFFEKK